MAEKDWGTAYGEGVRREFGTPSSSALKAGDAAFDKMQPLNKAAHVLDEVAEIKQRVNNLIQKLLGASEDSTSCDTADAVDPCIDIGLLPALTKKADDAHVNVKDILARLDRLEAAFGVSSHKPMVFLR